MHGCCETVVHLTFKTVAMAISWLKKGWGLGYSSEKVYLCVW